jgi:KAP family P-loop domain
MTTPPRTLVQAEIARFLRSPNPEVLCISGTWGIGKTHLWKDVLKETVASKDKPAFLDYSYVSLFGVDSLEGLRQSIFANQENLSEKKIKKGFRFGLKALKGTQTLLESIPKAGPLFTALGSLYFSSVRNMVICIDDLERRSNALTVRDVLGLISFLREERNCKVSLLLNDGMLGDEEADFRSYFEKVIDGHLRFEPTAKESAAIAFPNLTGLDTNVLISCEALGIKNIRIIHKIRRAVMDVQPHLQGHSFQLASQVNRAIPLLAWVVLESSHSQTAAPPLDFLRAWKGAMAIESVMDDDLPVVQQQWNFMLSMYKWNPLDELDEEIIMGLKAGYFDPATFKAAADIVQKRIDYENENGRFEESWDLYRESFENNPDEVLDGMYAAFKQTYKTISFLNFDSTVRLFRDLGRNEQAEELIKFFVDNRDEPQEFWDLDSHSATSDVKDAAVRRAITKKFKSFGDAEVSMTDLLLAMGSTKIGYQDKNVEAIAKLPVSDYAALFRKERGDRMRRIVEGGLLARRTSNPTEAMKKVYHLTMEALAEIAKESPLNMRRMESLFQVQFTSKNPEKSLPPHPIQLTGK